MTTAADRDVAAALRECFELFDDIVSGRETHPYDEVAGDGTRTSRRRPLGLSAAALSVAGGDLLTEDDRLVPLAVFRGVLRRWLLEPGWKDRRGRPAAILSGQHGLHVDSDHLVRWRTATDLDRARYRQRSRAGAQELQRAFQSLARVVRPEAAPTRPTAYLHPVVPRIAEGYAEPTRFGTSVDDTVAWLRSFTLGWTQLPSPMFQLLTTDQREFAATHIFGDAADPSLATRFMRAVVSHAIGRRLHRYVRVLHTASPPTAGARELTAAGSMTRQAGLRRLADRVIALWWYPEELHALTKPVARTQDPVARAAGSVHIRTPTPLAEDESAVVGTNHVRAILALTELAFADLRTNHALLQNATTAVLGAIRQEVAVLESGYSEIRRTLLRPSLPELPVRVVPSMSTGVDLLGTPQMTEAELQMKLGWLGLYHEEAKQAWPAREVMKQIDGAGADGHTLAAAVATLSWDSPVHDAARIRQRLADVMSHWLVQRREEFGTSVTVPLMYLYADLIWYASRDKDFARTVAPAIGTVLDSYAPPGGEERPEVAPYAAALVQLIRTRAILASKRNDFASAAGTGVDAIARAFRDIHVITGPVPLWSERAELPLPLGEALAVSLLATAGVFVRAAESAAIRSPLGESAWERRNGRLESSRRHRVLVVTYAETAYQLTQQADTLLNVLWNACHPSPGTPSDPRLVWGLPDTTLPSASAMRMRTTMLEGTVVGALRKENGATFVENFPEAYCDALRPPRGRLLNRFTYADMTRALLHYHFEHQGTETRHPAARLRVAEDGLPEGMPDHLRPGHEFIDVLACTDFLYGQPSDAGILDCVTTPEIRRRLEPGDLENWRVAYLARDPRPRLRSVDDREALSRLGTRVTQAKRVAAKTETLIRPRPRRRTSS